MARFEEEEGKVVAREEILTERKVIQPLRLHDFASANEKSFHRIFRAKFICVCVCARALHDDSIKIMRHTEYLKREIFKTCSRKGDTL